MIEGNIKTLRRCREPWQRRGLRGKERQSSIRLTAQRSGARRNEARINP